jgi:hypothetical protein
VKKGIRAGQQYQRLFIEYEASSSPKPARIGTFGVQIRGPFWRRHGADGGPPPDIAVALRSVTLLLCEISTPRGVISLIAIPSPKPVLGMGLFAISGCWAWAVVVGRLMHYSPLRLSLPFVAAILAFALTIWLAPVCTARDSSFRIGSTLQTGC